MAVIPIVPDQVALVKIEEAITPAVAGVPIAPGQNVGPQNPSGRMVPGGARGIAFTRAIAAKYELSVMKKGVLELGDALQPLPFGAPVFGRVDGSLDDAAPGVNERQTVTLTGPPTGGTFTLSFEGATTAGTAFNASADDVRRALEALASIGAGNVSVAGAAGGPYTVAFINDLGMRGGAQMTASGAGLTAAAGVVPGVTVATPPGGGGLATRQVGIVMEGWNDRVPRKLLRVDL